MRAPSARREELLERSYRYALAHGLADLSLRPLAAAVGSSPRVLLFLFGSKEGLVKALLARARTEELNLLDQARDGTAAEDIGTMVRTIWRWLADEAHRPLLTLWAEAYTRSLVDPDGPWASFARQTVEDWLAVLATAQLVHLRNRAVSTAERTLTLSVLRGALLDLLATQDIPRTTAAVEQHLLDIRSRT